MSTLVQRIALLAQRLNIPLVTTASQTHLGLYGTIRYRGILPVTYSAKLPTVIEEIEPGRTVERTLAEFSGGKVWAWVQTKTDGRGFRAPEKGTLPEDFLRCSEGSLPPEQFRLVLANAQLALICQLTQDGRSLRAIHASTKIPRPATASLVIAEFATVGDYDPELRDFCTMVAMQARVRTMVHIPAVESEAAADRHFVTGVRRYLESLRDHAKSSTPRIRYQIVGRSPIRIRTENEDAWPRVFTRPGTKLMLPATGRPRALRVFDVSDDDVLTLDGDDAKGELLERDELLVHPDIQSLQRMREALDVIAIGAEDSHIRLIEALTRPGQLRPLPPPPIPVADDEVARQLAAKALALNTPDIALIHGPPGTGKTTVISNIVEALVKAGKRVLLVAPTHVALDNVLERVGDAPGVTAIRLGSPDNVDFQAHRYLLQHRTRDLTSRLSRELLAAVDTAPAGDPVVALQREWAGRIAQDEEAGTLLLLNANLICATPIGIAMAGEFRDVDATFDVMIMDEASKATLTDFLVPAARARKWILVGDHRQLPPFVDVGELRAVVSERAKRSGILEPHAKWLDDVSSELRRHFDNRMHPDLRRVQHSWQQLVAKLAEPFDLKRSEIDELCALGADPVRWRQQRSTKRSTSAEAEFSAPKEKALRLGAELLELQALALPSVFERLTHLPSDRAVRLNYQHRMSPTLAEFSATAVYGGDYPSAASTHLLGLAIPTLEAPSIWIDTAYTRPHERYEHPRPAPNVRPKREDDWSSGGYFNPLEVDVAVEVVEACAAWAVKSWRGDPRPNGRGANASFELGIIAFYLKQAIELREAIFQKLGHGNDPWRRQWKTPAANGAPIDIHVSIVDRFQGREKDLIVLCTTRSNPRGFRGHVDNLNRLNVAVTRARHKRIIIGDSTTLAGQGGGKSRPEGDLLRCLYDQAEQKRKWGKVLGGAE